MGQVIGSFLAESEKHHEEDTVEQLQILQRLAAAKLEAQALKIANAAFEDKCLPIVAVVDKVERYAVKAESAPSDKVRECISNIFQGQFLKGLENAVGTAVNELLGNTSAGEQERSETHVVFANNSLLRVDYYCYKYEFGSQGLRDKFRNAFSYVVQVGVLDNLRVDPQIALYELGKSIGRDQIREASATLEEDANLLEHLYHVIKRLRKAAADDETEPQNPPAMQETKHVSVSESQKLKASKYDASSASGSDSNSSKRLWINMTKFLDYKVAGNLSQVKVNSDGVPAKKGMTGLYYCGRRILSCTCCDGHCGPNNGCNCPSCKKLDQEEEQGKKTLKGVRYQLQNLPVNF